MPGAQLDANSIMAKEKVQPKSTQHSKKTTGLVGAKDLKRGHGQHMTQINLKASKDLGTEEATLIKVNPQLLNKKKRHGSPITINEQ